MSFDTKTDQMNWKDEFSWMGICSASGLIMTLFFAAFDRFPGASLAVVALSSCLGFYLLSILLRLQNHRGEFWLGRTILKERRLKFIVPVVGFLFGLALLIF